MPTKAGELVERLVAVEAKEGVQIRWLGTLVWFTISESAVDEPRLRAAFRAAGIDERYIPPLAHPKDAMRRAVKAAEVAREPLGRNRYLNVLVRQVAQGPDSLLYHLVEEEVDAAGRRLSYRQVARVALLGDAVTSEPIDRPSPVAAAALERISPSYYHHLRHYDGNALRRAINRVLDDCHPVAVRPSGGVLFVPVQYAGTVEALRRLVTDLAAYGTVDGHRSVLRAVPVVDAAEQRDMVNQSLEEQVAADTKALLEELDAAGQGGGITERGVQTFIARIRRLQAMVAEYEELLETRKSDARAGLEVAMARARALLERV
jgi:hypothetical protein